jgi:uncharacterized protein YeaO (DUF488 family)/DNA-binding MarR family transcriptional regulator
MAEPDAADLGEKEFRELLELRTELRRFLHWSETRARLAGVTPAQHQLLLVVRGHDGASGPTINDIAETLLLKHHSAVELVQRAEVAGLVARHSDAQDHRVVRVTLGTAGHEALARLAPLHLEEIRRLRASGHALAAGGGEGPDGAAPRVRAAPGRDAPVGDAPVGDAPVGDAPSSPGAGAGTRLADEPLDVTVRDVGAAPPAGSAWRVLVDRRWPAGIRADDAPFDEWLASLAPPGALARAMGEVVEPDGEVAAAYRSLLHGSHGAELDRLVTLARTRGLVLVTGAPDAARSPAAVVVGALQERAGRGRAGPASSQ